MRAAILALVVLCVGCSDDDQARERKRPALDDGVAVTSRSTATATKS